MNISLALSGGGVKGFAHIGSLRVLEKEGFRIQGMAGTSAGGLVGALYAAGYSPDELEDRLRHIDQGNFFSRMHGDGPALLGLAGVTAILSELLGERTFDDLRIPLALTATDLNTGLPVVIKQGRLIDAVLATSAVPGVFPARLIGGHRLVDGGIMNPIPVAEARALYPNGPVVAIVLSPPLGWQDEANNETDENIPLLMTNLPLVYRLAGKLRLAQAFNLFIYSMDLSGLMLMDKQLKLEKPEVIIRPKLGPMGIIDQVDIPEVIKSGELATREALVELRKALSWQYHLRQRISRLISP
jgi:NTE family protein